MKGAEVNSLRWFEAGMFSWSWLRPWQADHVTNTSISWKLWAKARKADLLSDSTQLQQNDAQGSLHHPSFSCGTWDETFLEAENKDVNINLVLCIYCAHWHFQSSFSVATYCQPKVIFVFLVKLPCKMFCCWLGQLALLIQNVYYSCLFCFNQVYRQIKYTTLIK